MKILILGGNRFIGKKLSKKLVSRGDEVTVFNRRGTGNLNCKIIKGDRNNIDDLAKVQFDEYDQIVDMCLYNTKQFSLIKSLIGNTPYIFISSCAVFKDNIVWPINENSGLGGMTAYGTYGTDKYLVEKDLENSDINYTILRPTYIDGVDNHSPRIKHYINAIKNKEEIEISGNGENLLNIVLDDDVVESIINVFGNYEKNSYIISSNECLTVNTLINLISEELNEPVYKIYNSEKAIFPYVHYGVFNNEKIKHTFNQDFKSIKEIITLLCT